MTNANENKLDTFQDRCLWRILEVSNKEVRERVKIEPVCTQSRRRRWRWIGHVFQMEQGVIQTWEPEGKKKRGRLKETWRESIERTARDGHEILGLGLRGCTRQRSVRRDDFLPYFPIGENGNDDDGDRKILI